MDILSDYQWVTVRKNDYNNHYGIKPSSLSLLDPHFATFALTMLTRDDDKDQ